MVIYIFGKVAGAVGPLPYDVDECNLRAKERMVELDEGFTSNPERSVIDGKTFERKDVTFACVKSETRPQLEKFVVKLDGADAPNETEMGK